MKPNRSGIVAASLTTIILSITAGSAFAAHTVYVNPNTGTNTPPCGAGAPCQTITYAITQADANGEVVLVANGVYDSFTVAKNLTVRAAKGLSASVVAPSGGTGITVNGAGISVQLQGIDVSGATTGTTSTNCINFLAGTKLSLSLGMTVSNCAVGVNMAASGVLNIKETRIWGGAIAGGVGVQASAGSTHVDRSSVDGVMPGGALVMTSNAAKVFLEESDIGATASIAGMAGVLAYSSANTYVVGCTIMETAWGIFTNAAAAKVCVRDSKVTMNALGLFPQAGNICDLGNNMVFGNATNGSFTGCSCP